MNVAERPKIVIKKSFSIYFLFISLHAHIKSQAVITNHYKQLKFDATNKTKKST